MNNLIQSKKISFFITRREIEKSFYEEFQVEKFSGLQSDMEIAKNNFTASGGKVEQLIEDLAVDPAKFTYQDEIYLVHVEIDKVGKKIPDGLSPGAAKNDDWRPLGYLRPFKNRSTGETVFAREAVFFKTDGTTFVHNRNWNDFVAIFGQDNVIRINP